MNLENNYAVKQDDNKTIGIVIVNYNGQNYQNKCIESILKSSYEYFKIIIIDNASTDNSIGLLNEINDSRIFIFKQPENYGVAKGNNIGIKKSLEMGCKYTLLLNNDVEIHSLLLQRMIMQVKSDTVVVPKIFYYNPNNLIWYSGGKISWNKVAGIHFGIDKEDNEKYNIESFVSYAPTTCMLIENCIFRKVGLMDEAYFLYYDDVDFCVRLTENCIHIKYEPNAVLWHKVSSSTGGAKGSKFQSYYNNRNQLYFMHKFNRNISSYVKYKILLRTMLKFIFSPIYKKHNKVVLEAVLDYFNNRMGKYRYQDLLLK